MLDHCPGFDDDMGPSVHKSALTICTIKQGMDNVSFSLSHEHIVIFAHKHFINKHKVVVNTDDMFNWGSYQPSIIFCHFNASNFLDQSLDAIYQVVCECARKTVCITQNRHVHPSSYGCNDVYGSYSKPSLTVGWLLSIWTNCTRIGEASKPGPKQLETTKHINIDVINISHLLNNADLINDRETDYYFVMEHSLRPGQYHDARLKFGKNAKMDLTKLDPTHTHQTGGVGIIQKSKQQIIKPKPLNKVLQHLNGESRFGLYGIRTSSKSVLMVYVVYGVTNGDTCPKAKQTTNAIIDAILDDIKLQPKGPKVVVGDLNASVVSLPLLQECVLKGELIDIGAIASDFGGTNCECTCRANTKSRETRRDYVFANREARNIISDFKVDRTANTLTHAILKLSISTCPDSKRVDVLKLPNTIQDAITIRARKLNENNEISKTPKPEKRKNLIEFEPDIQKEPIPIFPKKKIKDVELQQFIDDLLEEQHELDDEERKDKAQRNIDDETKQKIIQQMHKEMDDNLNKRKKEMDHLIRSHKMQDFLDVFSNVVEDSIIKIAEPSIEVSKDFKGRSTLNVQNVKQDAKHMFENNTETMVSNIAKHEQRILKQARRIKSILDVSLIYHKTASSDTIKRMRLLSELHNSFAALKANDVETDGNGEIIQHINSNLNSFKLNPFQMMRAYERNTKTFETLKLKTIQNRKQKRRDELNDANSHKQISKILKNNAAAPMDALKRPKEVDSEKPKGSLATDHEEIDTILRDIWKDITDGAPGDLHLRASMFVQKYEKYMIKLPEFQIGELSYESFIKCCRVSTSSAAGMDGWAPKDLALLSNLALELLVDMLREIENGAEWPKTIKTTRAVFLSKDPSDTQNPLAYRILKISSAIQRRWATTRNRDLKKWIEQWDHKAINAGVPFKGAVDAWYNTALQNELHLNNENEIAGGSVDIYKCFDQINRELLEKIALAAGMPKKICAAYFRFINDLDCRFQTGNKLGKTHQTRCSIPQGCPFSMLMVALLMTPWIAMMEEMEVSPRVLADDLLFTADGTHAITKTIQAMNTNIQFFQDIGAKIAANKCFLFASETKTRSFLKNITWQNIETKIPIKNSFRDLGAHLNFTRSKSGSTLTERMEKGIRMCARLKWLGINHQTKEKIILTNILPAALYGAETTMVAKATMAKLRTAIMDVIGPGSAKRSVEIAFDFTESSKELDPQVYVLTKRVLELRRNIAKNQNREGLIRLILKRLKTPRPNKKQKRSHSDWWRNNDEDETSKDDSYMGPVKLLMQSLDDIGWTLDENICMTKTGEIPIDLVKTPWNHLKKAINQMGQRARMQEFNRNRTFAGNIVENDRNVTRKICDKLDDGAKRIYRHIATGGFWSQDQLSAIGESNDACQHCGQLVQGVDHVLWECEAINKCRKHKQLCEIEHRFLPKPIKNGIAVEMDKNIDGSFWGAKYDQNLQNTIPKPQTKEAVGINDEGYDNIINSILQKNDVDENLNARQTFQHIKKVANVKDLPLPYRVWIPAPEAINVFTDGSWLHSAQHFIGIGGAGVWWPGRSIERSHTLKYKAPSDAESEIAVFKQQQHGVAAYANIGGFDGSSTRAEVAAGIIAIYAEGPIHIGTDSQAFVKKANKLIDDINRNNDEINWSLHSDGDLWELFHNALRAKTTQAVKITWIKGHATEKMVELGITTAVNMQGNARADEIADIGTELYTKEVVELAEKYHNRYEKYVKFMQNVVIHIIEAYMLHRKLIDYYENCGLHSEQNAADSNKGGDAKYKQLWYPNKTETRKIVPKTTLENFQNFRKNYRNSEYLQSFLHGIQIQTSGHERNISWFELYILYRIRGYPKPIPNPNEPMIKPTLDKQLAKFKKDLRSVGVKLMLANNFLKPSKPVKDDLVGVGIQGKSACLSFAVYVSQEEAKEIEYALHKLNHACSDKKWESLCKGNDSIKPRPIRLRGKTQWDDDLPQLQGPSFQTNDWEGIGKLCSDKPTNCCFFQCPKCLKYDTPKVIGINDQNLDQKIRCKHCKKSIACLDWLCPCSDRWFLCDTHRNTHLVADGISRKRKVKTPSDQKRPTKLLRSDDAELASFREVDKTWHSTNGDGSKRARRTTQLVSPPQSDVLRAPTKLGPILSARFGNLNRSHAA